MNGRRFLLGACTGYIAGYGGMRALEAAGILSPFGTARRSAQTYGRTRRALAVAGIARGLAASAAFVGTGLAGRIGASLPGPRPVRASTFALLSGIGGALVTLPIEFVEGYVLESDYGMTDQSVSGWLEDWAKETGVSLLVSSLLAVLALEGMHRAPRHWPSLLVAGAFPLLVVANLAIPLYVLPLFNRFTQVEGELRDRILRLTLRYGVESPEILRVDMSKQTRRANAYVTGIGTTHRIVVGDTLADRFPSEEIEFVVAHELGHYVAKDTWRMIAAAQVLVTIVTFVSARGIDEASVREANPAVLARLMARAGLASHLLRPLLSLFSRSREWAADRFAVEATNAAETGARALERLRDQNLAEDEQPAWYEFFFSTHPSLRARIDALRAPASATKG